MKQKIIITGWAWFIGSNFLNKYVLQNPEIDFINIDALTYAWKLENICNEVSNSPNYFFEKVDIRNIDEISKKELNSIKEKLTSFKIRIIDTLPIEKATVTSGGIKTSELDNKTMRSKFMDNVSFCGEVIDIQGPIGGYNLTLAFISGYKSGESIDFN